MLQAIVIGNLGANAEVKTANGREFTTFRIAHTDRWKDEAGQVHESTTWVDIIMNDRPKVLEYLKKGQMVYVQGNITLRVYSSQKDRCMKAGLTVNASKVELLGGRGDEVPAYLFREGVAEAIEVRKYYGVPSLANQEGVFYPIQLQSRSGDSFMVDNEGWVTPVKHSES